MSDPDRMSNSKVICVLGMHRSGTSAVARVLSLLGVYLGPEEHLMKPAPANPKGFWEHQILTDLNDELLAMQGGTWHEPPTYFPSWESSPQFADLRARARDLLDRDFGDAELWGWKDPRTCLTLPFWQWLLPGLHYVVCLRNPIDVARSLERQYGFPLEKGVRLWLTYVTSSLRHTSGSNRLFISYDDLMKDGMSVIGRLADFLGEVGQREPMATPESVQGILEEGLRHHRTSLVDTADERRLSFPAKALYLVTMSLGFNAQPSLNSEVQDATLQKAVDLFSAFALEDATEEERQSRLQQDHERLKRQLAEREQAVQVLTDQVAEREQAVQVLTDQVAERAQAVQVLTDQVAERAQAVQVLTDQMAEREQAVQALTAQVADSEETVQSLSDQLVEREHMVRSLETEVAERDRKVQGLTVQLNTIATSRAWRAGLLLRQICASLAPRNSRRARFLRLLVSPALGIARSFRLGRDLALIRASGLFDEGWYVANNRDVAEAKADPARHYLQYGGIEGRDPGPGFSSTWYLDSNPDVKAAKANPLLHYLKSGRSEGRAMGASGAEAPTQARGPDLRGKRSRKGFGHYLTRFIQVWRNQGARAAVRMGMEVLTTRRPAGTEAGPLLHATAMVSFWAPRDFAIKPLISIVMPTHNSQVNYLRSAIDSVQRQSYGNWELCVCDDGSTDPLVKRELTRIGAADNRIKVTLSEENAGISSATNKAAALAEGELLAFLDHDDELAPDALFWIVSLLNERPETDALYTDQDKIDGLGKAADSFYKPDWSPWLFRCVMYIGHLLVVRRELFVRVGGFDSTFDGVQDYEFMLRLSETTDRIAHVPRILYHWRSMPGSVAYGLDEKAGIEYAQVRAVNAHFQRVDIPGVASRHPTHRHRVMVRPIPRSSHPLVSIVVVTKDAPRVLGACLNSIQERTTYPNYEIVVVDNGTAEPEALSILQQDEYIVVPFLEGFNFSKANNLGVETAKGDVIVLLNNDTEVVTPEWLDEMVFYLGQPDVAVVGPLLLYPDRTVQHAGVVLGLRGTADHIMRGFPAGADGYAGSLCCPREVSAVTGACLMMRKADYVERGGLDEYYATHYQDVDLCLRVASSGKRIIYVPSAALIHHESVTRRARYDVLDRALLLDRWGELIARGDPFYNPNLSLDGPHYSAK